MATTTNYGWTTPDDTALVKDGASAIRTLGSSVDTTTKNLNPSTTLGDIEYRSSTSNTNTRLGIGTSGQALTVVAGVPAWAASATSTLTAKGDVLTATAANTIAKIAVGANDTVLTADSSTATGLKWATVAGGSMTSLATGSLSGSSVTISSISGSYKKLELRIVNLYSPGGISPAIRFNSDTGTNYNYTFLRSNSTTLSNEITKALLPIANSGDSTANRTQHIITIPAYTANARKAVEMTAVITTQAALGIGQWQSTSAITSITILFDGSDTFSGGTYELFGVN